MDTVQITIGSKETAPEENELTGERKPLNQAVKAFRNSFLEWDDISGGWVNFRGHDLAAK